MATPQRIVINIRDNSGEREAAQARRMIAYCLVGLTILMVYFCGLFPFDFSVSFAGAFDEIHQRFDFTTDQLFATPESLQKLIFYLPFGFALGSLFWMWRGLRPHQVALRCAMAILCSAALATSVELSQVFVSRDPSLADIISKTTGSTIGFGLFALLGEPAMRWLARMLISVKKREDPRIFGAIAGAWLFIAVIAPVAVRHLGSLNDWEPSFPMLIGNETDGVRHWDGTVSNVWLSAAAVDENQMDSLLTAPDPGRQLGNSLVARFHLSGAGPYTDGTGHTADLIWTPNFDKGATPGTTQPSGLTGEEAVGSVGVPLSEGWWLSTAKGGAAQASKRISQAQAFTLVLDLAMHDLDHGDGWPRIFSISKSGTECNLQLLQDHQDLQLRIRDGASGEGGSDPELIIPGIFSDTLMHRLVVTYIRGRVSVECSDSGERYSLQFFPDSWLVWRIFPSSFWHYRMNSSGQVVASSMYRVLVMLPIGLLLGAILRIQARRGRVQHSHFIFIASTCGAVFALEVVLYLGAGVPLSLSSPIVGMLAACAGTLAILGSLPVREQWI